MKDKEKQYISMKEMLTKRSFETITNCNCRQVKDGAFVDLLNQEQAELQKALKEKQIEEMAKPFSDAEKELLNDIYQGLGIQDWRDECIWKTARVENLALLLAKKYQPKLPEDSVVLSREEYEKYQNLKRDVEHSFEYNQGYTDGQKKGSKEMVEKFVKSIKNYDEFVQRADTDGALFYIDLVEWLYDIAKQLGVEIKEV